ncbi:MAG: hypothetical protein PHS92_01890 [Candidatus Gracilibacteria bacterium]|nr:hypothetical protein [Candidatus Gracilibacteria bacterium]
MKTKIITGLVLTGILATGALVYADSTNSGSIVRSDIGFKQGEGRFSGMMGDGEFRGPRGNMGIELTDAEKTSLKTMTADQKKAFFEQKRTDAEAKRTARENIIDKLLNGEILTDADKIIVSEIKAERAAEKTKQAEMKAKIEEIKPILEKGKAGQTLTDAEKTKLKELKPEGKGFPRMGGRGR